jgi:predicted histone-like DNA-binding protein
VDKNGEEEKIRYYGTAISSGTTGINDLAKEINIRCSLSEGDVLASLRELSNLLRQELASGNNVYLEGIGTFSLSASSEGFDTPEECTPSKIRPRRVCFKADKRLRLVMEKMTYKRTQRTSRYRKS